MALEAWVILRAAGAAITPNGALAVETFSRVASFASAFIPANLGALEASSLAAVAAVGAVGGGAALALARRLRGLFWAGVGLAIYPAQHAQRRLRHDVAALEPRHHADDLLYLPDDAAVSVSPSARLAGLPIAERVLRPACRAGYDRIVVWLPRDADGTPAAARAPGASIGGDSCIARTAEQWQSALAELAPADAVTAIGAGTVVSTALLADARDVPRGGQRGARRSGGTEWRVSGVVRLTARCRRRSTSRARGTGRAPRGGRYGSASGQEVSTAPHGWRFASSTPADLARSRADHPARELQGHRREGRALQPPHVAADQHRADARRR